MLIKTPLQGSVQGKKRQTIDHGGRVAKIRVLNDLISRHVEVEEDEVFPKAKNMLSDEQERKIREEYTKQKNLGSKSLPSQSM